MSQRVLQFGYSQTLAMNAKLLRLFLIGSIHWLNIHLTVVYSSSMTTQSSRGGNEISEATFTPLILSESADSTIKIK